MSDCKEDVGKSSEDYLETILMLKKDHKKVRSIDIVNHLNFSKPSVSIAMKKLKDKGYITIVQNKIELTEVGSCIANKIYARHKLLSQILISIGVDEETALSEACELEHCISNDTFQKIEKAVKNID